MKDYSPIFRIGNGYDTEYEDEDWFWDMQSYVTIWGDICQLGQGFGYHRMNYKLLKPIYKMLKELARKNRMPPYSNQTI